MEQNRRESSEGVVSEDGGPSEGGWAGRMRDDPELDVGMKDDGHGFEARGGDGPVAAEQFDGMIVGGAARKMDGEMQIAERDGRRGFEL